MTSMTQLKDINWDRLAAFSYVNSESSNHDCTHCSNLKMEKTRKSFASMSLSVSQKVKTSNVKANPTFKNNF